jgi:hypothetical protein
MIHILLIPLFFRCHISSLLHVAYFIKVMRKIHIIHKDVWMRTFLCTFDEKETYWFYDLGKEQISTFAYFL